MKMKVPTNKDIEKRIKELTEATKKYPKFKGHIKLGQRAYEEGAKWMREQIRELTK